MSDQPLAGATGPERFELCEELGSGAVATVHRVRDRATGHDYAAKILHERNARDVSAAERFEREVELARTLRDPHIVAVHGIVELAGRRALLMELVEGPTLASIIAEDAPLPTIRLLQLGRDIARGLAVAHVGGVIHRDLKPANILVARGGERELAKIADFGMARATSFAGVDRSAMVVLGTPDYMAPESLDPLAVDPRSDLYGLGCILFELATGQPPFRAPTPFAVLDAHRRKPIPELPELPPEHPDDPRLRRPEALRELITGLLAKQPSDRPHAASVVLARLDGLLAELTNLSSPAGALALRQPSPLVAAPIDRLAQPRRDPLSAAKAGRCARCSAPVVLGVGVCLECGLLRVTIERGRWAVFVTGPGDVGDKLPSPIRARLIDWLDANPDVGLDADQLRQKIPRLPFTLVTGVSRASAEALQATLVQLGLQIAIRRGGRLALPRMPEKALRLGARRVKPLAIVLLFAAPVLLPLTFLLLPVFPFYFFTVAWILASPTAKALPAHPLALPSKIVARLRLIEQRSVALAPRHRPALRAVVQRVLALIEATPVEQRDELDGELDHALNLALVATERMDELDRAMARPDFDPGDSEQRQDLQERDLWSARLLELTATLDALAARQLAARQALRENVAHERSRLDELRARIEALEEVQR